MSQDDIDAALETIKNHLQYDDEYGQAIALSNLKKILSEKAFSSPKLTEITDLLIKMYRQREETLITDVIEILCLIGKQDFKQIREVFTELKTEIPKKNRYHLAPILDLISKYISTNILEIEEVTKDLLENGAIYCKRADLQKILISFWEKVGEQGFGFISKFNDQIVSVLPMDKVNIPEIEDTFSKKLKGYEEFLKAEEVRKKKIALELEAEREKREELRKKRLELMEKMREKITKEDSTTADSKSELISTTSSGDDIQEEKQGGETENPNFVSFSSLGLKKKDK